MLAEESGFDRYVLWRLASWGCGAVGAVTLAVLINQSSIGFRHDALASADLTRQAQQVKSLVGDNQTETRRLSSAIDTLNADRDRLYSRVTVLEQGLDTVTGSISRQIRTPELAQANAAPSSGTGSTTGVGETKIAGCLPLPCEIDRENASSVRSGCANSSTRALDAAGGNVGCNFQIGGGIPRACCNKTGRTDIRQRTSFAGSHCFEYFAES